MTKTYYVSSGDLNKEVQAESPLDACIQALNDSLPGDRLGRIMKVSDKGFEGDKNPWYVLTEVAIKAAGHKPEGSL